MYSEKAPFVRKKFFISLCLITIKIVYSINHVLQNESINEPRHDKTNISV
jgi:hypothetical protein